MSAEPAPVHISTRRHDPGALEDVLRMNEQMGVELAATRKALASAHRRETMLRKELDDVYEQAADDEEVVAFLQWWRKTTGRGQRTRVDASSDRARWYRKARRHWTAREVCFMVRGVMADRYRVERGWTDVEDIVRVEKHAERFLAVGRALSERKA